MSCTFPARPYSPGHLVLFYHHDAGPDHTVSMGLNRTVDISSISPLRVEANALAFLFSACNTVKFTWLDWGIRLPDGSLYYREPLTAPITGSHAVATSAQNLFSSTVTLTGKADAISVGDCTGQFRSMIFVGAAFEFVQGEKARPSSADTAIAALIARLNLSVFVPADYYGQTGSYRARFTVQYNAHAQKRNGS
jgi:hypothetical protein